MICILCNLIRKSYYIIMLQLLFSVKEQNIMLLQICNKLKQYKENPLLTCVINDIENTIYSQHIVHRLFYIFFGIYRMNIHIENDNGSIWCDTDAFMNKDFNESIYYSLMGCTYDGSNVYSFVMQIINRLYKYIDLPMIQKNIIPLQPTSKRCF